MKRLSGWIPLLLVSCLVCVGIILVIARESPRAERSDSNGIRYLFPIPSTSSGASKADLTALATWPKQYVEHIEHVLRFIGDFSRATNDPRGERIEGMTFFSITRAHRAQLVHGASASAMYDLGENQLGLDYAELADGAVAFFPTVNDLYHELGHAVFDDQEFYGNVDDPNIRERVFSLEASNYARDEDGMRRMKDYVSTLPGVDPQTLRKWRVVLEYFEKQAKCRRLISLIRLDSIRFGRELFPHFQRVHVSGNVAPERFEAMNARLFELTVFNFLPDAEITILNIDRFLKSLANVEEWFRPEIEIPGETLQWISEWQTRVVEFRAALEVQKQAENELEILWRQ